MIPLRLFGVLSFACLMSEASVLHSTDKATASGSGRHASTSEAKIREVDGPIDHNHCTTRQFQHMSFQHEGVWFVFYSDGKDFRYQTSADFGRTWKRADEAVAPAPNGSSTDGYLKSWNIVSEHSNADDRGFIEAIVLKLATFENVDPNNFSIMGASNGAALVNQLAIESKLPNIRNYISGVSPLNVWQYDGKHFKAKGDDNNYHVAATPMTGKRLRNISGTDDKLVPYHGGPSKVIPAKDGKLAFVAAEESTFVWARQMGYEGEQLTVPTRTSGNLEIFSYLSGDVVHCKVNNEGHGATHGISEEMLLGGENAGQQ